MKNGNKSRYTLFVGLKVTGVDDLAVPGGENPEDFHVTLAYGYFNPPSDEEDASARIQKAVEAVKEYIPDTIQLDAISRFEASDSSDGKDVIYARVKAGQLQEVHEKLIAALKLNGIRLEDTFPQYKPHMTLAYIDPDSSYRLSSINETAKVEKIIIGTGEDGEDCQKHNFSIQKKDEEKRLVFGWANVAIRADGEQIKDFQNDIIDPEDLEEAVYDYVLNFRDGGEEHRPGLRKKARMVESVVFTDEKLEAMGIPKGTVPYGWWIGFKVDDDEAWEKVKDGTYTMFSVEGTGQRVPVDDKPRNGLMKSVGGFFSGLLRKASGDYGTDDSYIMPDEPDIDRMMVEVENEPEGGEYMKKSALSFSDIEKFNPYHGKDGRFTTADGATMFTYKPGKGKMYDNAIAREKERQKASGGSYGITPEQEKRLLELSEKGAVFRANKYRKEIGMSDDAFDKFRLDNADKIKAARDKRKRDERAEQERKKTETDERVKTELPGLDQEAIRRANGVSFFDHGSVAAREALQRVDSYKERNKPQDDWTDEQKAYAKQREEEYKQLVTDYYNDQNRRFANNPSWMVTGPARYNSRRSEKLNRSAANKADEYEQKLKNFEENTKKRIASMDSEEKQISRWRQGAWKYGETIAADDPLAERKLQAKLDYMKENHERMKSENAAARGTGKKPHPTWQLSNSNQQIRATEERLKSMKRAKEKAEQGGGGDTSFKGGKVVRNTGINRLQLVFDDIPSPEVRSKLKSEGWRWSPREKAWQRQLTDNAERSAQRLIGSFEKSYHPIGGAATFYEVFARRA